MVGIMKILKASIGLVISISVLPPATSFAQVKPHDASTAAMVELCKARDDIDAQNFCFGFGEGVYQAYLASRPAGSKPSICLAANNHTREQILDDFLRWNQKNPQFNSEQAAKTLIRFFKQRYPCK